MGSEMRSPFEPPRAIDAKVLTSLPDAWNVPRTSSWSASNRGTAAIGSFLEGPAFDRSGNLYVVDIPHGRIFRIAPSLDWQVAAEYDGWPNGVAIHRDGKLWITDYRRGLLMFDPTNASITPLLDHNRSESFRGVNDLTFSMHGDCLFTDQGQTGLHDPTGRVYRLSTSGQLQILLSNVPSPNGVALHDETDVLYVAATRANNIWRVPLVNESPTKVGVYQTFFGPGGPDGLALDEVGQLIVAHASLGCAVLLGPTGAITHYVRGPEGCIITNVAFRPGTDEIVMTDASAGRILQARLPHRGAALFSHGPT